MKTLIKLAIVLCFLSACSSKGDNDTTYTLTYVIFYPNHSDTIVVSSNIGYQWYSSQGTNYIHEVHKYSSSSSGKSIYVNTAPFKVLSYTESLNKTAGINN